MGGKDNSQKMGKARVMPIECLKRVDSCGHLLVDDLIVEFSEAICLRMVWGHKHQLDT